MKWLQITTALTGIAACGLVLAQVAPQAREAGAILTVQDDPAALSELQLDAVLRKDDRLVQDNIEAALAAGDADLADSFVALARDRNLALPDDLLSRVGDAVKEEGSSSHFAKRFAIGLVTGNADDVASLSGTVAGDLFVIGDIRDVVREGKHLAMGEDTDRLVLGLATAGLAVTAATYVSVGGAAPVRAGLTLVKDARKVGRLGEGLAAWAGRSAREVVDTPMLQNAVASGSVLRPGETVSAIKAAFRAEKAGALVRLGKDVDARRREDRHARCHGHAAHRRRPEGRRARGAARGSAGRQDARDHEAVRPRRLAADRRRVRSGALAVRRGIDAVRPVGFDQGDDGAPDPGLVRSQTGAPAPPGAARSRCRPGKRCRRGLKRGAFRLSF